MSRKKGAKTIDDLRHEYNPEEHKLTLKRIESYLDI
jgi:hypothetical protein